VGDDLGGGARLHNFPPVHDGDAGGKLAGGAQVVGDVDEGQLVAVLELPEEGEDLGPEFSEVVERLAQQLVQEKTVRIDRAEEILQAWKNEI